MVSILSLENDCTLMPYRQDVKKKCERFSCGNQDLDDFFQEDVFLYEEEMLGKTYCWVTNTKPHKIVGVITVSNDSIKSSALPKNSRNRFNRLFNNEKRNKTYPATLIGRLGVNTEFQGHHIGKQIMEFVKMRTIMDFNFNACRFIVVDAYNTPATIAFYERNGFVMIHKTEEIERCALRRYNEDGDLIYELDSEESLVTRLMYYDLKKVGH